MSCGQQANLAVCLYGMYLWLPGRISACAFPRHPDLQETTSCFSLKWGTGVRRKYYIIHKLQKVISRGIYEYLSEGFWIHWTSFENFHVITGCKLHERNEKCCMIHCIPRNSRSAGHRAGISKSCWINEHVGDNAFLNFLFAWNKWPLSFRKVPRVT